MMCLQNHSLNFCKTWSGEVVSISKLKVENCKRGESYLLLLGGLERRR